MSRRVRSPGSVSNPRGKGVSPEQGGLRVGITGGGCSGLSYNIRFDTQPRERDRTFVFGAGLETPNDPSGAKPVKIFVDPKSFIYLAGIAAHPVLFMVWRELL